MPKDWAEVIMSKERNNKAVLTNTMVTATNSFDKAFLTDTIVIATNSFDKASKQSASRQDRHRSYPTFQACMLPNI